MKTSFRRSGSALAVLGVVAGLMLLPAGAASAATVIDGPIDLGVAETFSVLAASGATNTGPSVLTGDLGVSGGVPPTGFGPPATIGGSTYVGPGSLAADAQLDLDDAMETAASLSPTVTGLANLTGMTLVPGVYAGGALLLDGGGQLRLDADGDTTAIWVFTASSTLITGGASEIILEDGASACNVFWLVGSSATFGTSTDFVGTVMAQETISDEGSSVVNGRLLANTAAVTLIDTEVTVPTDCDDPGTTTTTGEPAITSGTPTDATVGEPYSFSFTASGTGTISYGVTSGAVPDGLTLNTTTGLLSGTPLDADADTFTVTASNGSARTASVIATVVTRPAAAAAAPAAALLPPTGVEPGDTLLPLVVIAVGVVLVVFGTRRRSLRRH
jgi:hypothetical protein